MKLSKFASIILASSIMFMAGCGSSTTENEGSNLVTVSGSVVDGPIYNAKVCVDYNFNGKCDANEPSAVTDVNGKYTLKNVDMSVKVPVIVLPQDNCVDMITKKPFTKIFSAPLDGNNVNINPVTTLVGAYMYKLHNDGNLTDEALNSAKMEIAKAFGIDNDNITETDITKYPAAYAKAVAIVQLLPDVNQTFAEIDHEMNLNELNEGNLTAMISDPNIKEDLEYIEENKKNIASLDSEDIQRIVEYAVKNDPSVLNQTPEYWKQIIFSSYPITTKLGTYWGVDWYKIDAFYPGDERFSKADIELDYNDTSGYIRLYTQKIDGKDSRAQVAAYPLDNAKGFSAKVNLVTDNVYSQFQVLAIKKDINTSNVLSGLNYNTNLTFIAGLTVQKNKIIYWWDIEDQDGHYYEQNVKYQSYSDDLTNLTNDRNDLQIDVNYDGSNITYKVYAENNGSLIFDASLPVSDTNMTNFEGFGIASFRSRIRDDEAAQNGDTALDESLNYINDFNLTK
ncbi:hypothetical protein [Caminibacter sp.]